MIYTIQTFVDNKWQVVGHTFPADTVKSAISIAKNLDQDRNMTRVCQHEDNCSNFIDDAVVMWPMPDVVKELLANITSAYNAISVVLNDLKHEEVKQWVKRMQDVQASEIEAFEDNLRDMCRNY